MESVGVKNVEILGKEYYEGDKELNIFKAGKQVNATDFSILEGQSNNWTGETGEKFFGNVLIGTVKDGEVYQYTYMEFIIPSTRDSEGLGIRPAMKLKSIDDIPSNNGKIKKTKSNISEVEYGYYPQQAVPNNMQQTLEKNYNEGKLIETKDIYTRNSPEAKSEGFMPQEINTYEYKRKRYVRVKASINLRSNGKLSNGEKYSDNDYVWVEVQPIEWLVDKEAKIMLTKKIMASGIPIENLNEKDKLKDGNLKSKNIDEFLEHFSKEMLQKIPERAKSSKVQKTRLGKLNPDKTPEEERIQMSDTEKIKNWIDSGETVLLIGPSGIGKTQRLKEQYPNNLISLKLTNNMLPEKVVGSENIQTGEAIPPDYAKQIILASATKEEKEQIEDNIQNIYQISDQIYERSQESDEKIVVLLDELLNVNPHVQSLVYTLVLNKFVETGKGIKLPKNVVIVATGNQQKYSNVSYDLAEPLKKRFDHIMYMKPKVREWLYEYAIPHNLHPSVVSFILSKYIEAGESEDLEDIQYLYEEPEVGENNLDEYGCPGRTNDPRSWDAISQILNNFEKNLVEGKYVGLDVEDLLQDSIGTKLREEWSDEFFDFYNTLTLTPEEVVNHNYTKEDCPSNLNERIAFTLGLVTADEMQVKECREYIKKYCDPEYLGIYDKYWAGNDEKRQEMIAELQDLDWEEHDTSEIEPIFNERNPIGIAQVATMYKNNENKKENKEENENDERTK